NREEIMNRRMMIVYAASAAALVASLATIAAQPKPTKRTAAPPPAASAGFDQQISNHAQALLEEGRRVFRFDTFGSEAFWGDQLELHKAIAGEKNGGVGPGVSPKTALAVGLKVDAAAIPAALAQQIKAGKVDLDDPAKQLRCSRSMRSSGSRPGPMHA